MKQLTKLQATQPARFKNPATGRWVTIALESRWWVTNTESQQQTDGIVMLQRDGKGHIGTGYPFAHDDVLAFFKILVD